MQTYTVVSGDTLSGIARRFSIPLTDLIHANPTIVNPNLIRVGQVLTVPVPPASRPPTTIPQSSPAVPPKNLSDYYDIKPVFREGTSGGAGTALIKGMFDDVAFSFNPEEIEDTKGNVWDFTDPSNHYYPIIHHRTGKTPTISFDLYVNDNEEEGAVDRIINKLNSHVPYRAESRGFSGLPPKPMIFSFGKFFVKKVWLEEFRVRRKTFNTELKTMEADISISLFQATE